MPLPYTRAPRRAAVPVTALPVPEEDDDAPAPVATPQRTGTTGGIIPQGAGTFDPPAPGRLYADPAQRQQQSLARAQAGFAAKQQQENPFIFSNDIKQLSKVGGRRYDDAAIRQGEQQYKEQVRGDKAAAALDTATYNSQAEAHFRGRGQQFYEDNLTKRFVPVLEADTGRALYHETPWTPSQHPKSGLPVFEKRDKYGQRQFKRPVLKDSTDPEDENLYADMGDGDSLPYMTKAEAAKSGDISLAKAGLAALKKQRTTRAMDAINGMKTVDESVDTEVLSARQNADELQRQIDELSPKASNSGDTEVNRAAYQSRIGQLSQELQKQTDALKPHSELMRRQRISKKSLGVARARAALDAYSDQKAEIEARLAARGLAPQDYGSDPIYQQNMQGLTAAQKAVQGGEDSIQQEETLRRRINPAATPDPVANDLQAGEPAAVAARGGDRIGGVGIDAFAQRYGSGEGAVSPQDTLKLFRRGREIQETLDNPSTKIDDKLRTSLQNEQQYVDALYTQRLARLPAEQQTQVQDAVALATEGGAKSAAKAGARGALAEGSGAVQEGGSRLFANSPIRRGLESLEDWAAEKIQGFPLTAQQKETRRKLRERVADQTGTATVDRFANDYATAMAQTRQQLRNALPLDEQFAKSIGGQISQGIGQAAGTLPFAAIPGGIAASSISQIYDEGWQDAVQSGASPEQANRTALKYLPAATLDYLSEKLIVGRLLKPLVGKMTVGQFVKDVLASAVTEGGTEGAQQAYLNQIASKLEGYDPDRPFDKEVYDSMLVGAVTGGVVTGVGQVGTAALGQTPPETTGPADAPQAPVTPAPTGPTDARAAAEAELQRKLAALSPEERAEMERLLAESEPVQDESPPTREDRQAQLEDTFGFVRPERVNPKSAEGSAEVFMEQAAEPLAVQTMRADAEQAERDRLSQADTENAPEEIAAISEVNEDLAGERAAAAQTGVTVEELRAARRNVDAAGGARTDRDIPTSNEPIPEPVAAQSPVPTPEVPDEQPTPAAPDVPAATPDDRTEYDRLTTQLTTMVKQAGTPEYNAVQQQIEDIKNRNQGMPPGEVAGGEISNERPELTTEVRNETTGKSSGSDVAPEAVQGNIRGDEVRVSEATPRSSEQRLNDAGIDLPPVSSMKRPALRAELASHGVTEVAGVPISENENSAQLMNAVGKLRRGQPLDAPRTTDKIIQAIQNAKIHKPGQLSAATPISIAYDAALDLAIVAIRAGRSLADAIKLAVARYRAVNKDAKTEDIDRLTQAITDAHNGPPPTPPTTTNQSRLPESLKDSGAPVESIDYDVRNQEARKEEASKIVRDQGPTKAEAALDDKSIPGDTRVAIGGQLINERMLALKDAKPEEVGRITRDIQRITAKMQPSLATEAGQQIAMFSAIYKDVRTASAMEYIRNTTKRLTDALGGEPAVNAAQEAADIFNKKLTDAERNAAIEALKAKYTEKPVRKMLNEFKRMETAKKLNALGVLTRDDMVEVAGNALGIPGISQTKLKHLAEISDRIENAKTPAERHRAELELADTLSIYKGVNPLDLEASILTLNILSGPTTQLANLEGNALNAIAQLGTTALANPSKIGPLVQGLIDGIGLGATQGKSILQTGRGTRDLQDKTSMAGSALQNVDYARDFPQTGPAAPLLTARARAVEKIGRFMKAADAVFYYPAREAYARLVTTKLLEGKFSGPELDRQVRRTLHITPEAFASATEQARQEGYEGIDLARRTSDIIEERRAQTPEGAQAVKESERFAAEATYNQEPEGLAGVVYRNASNLVQQARVAGAPILKPWLMFLRVPANVFNATTNFTPMGAVRAGLGVQSSKPGERRNFNKNERNRLYIQSVIGTTLMSAMILRILDKDDLDVTAGGPTNPAQKKQLQQGGWLPYSVKIGGKYYSYKDSPLLVPLSIVGNVADSVKYQKAKNEMVLENKVTDAIAQAPQVIFQTSMLSGLADLMSSLSSKNGAENLGRSLASVPANLLIPYNRLLQQIDQVFDDKQYDTGNLKRTVPFLRRDGEVKTDVQGRPEKYDPFSRFGSAESKDPLDALIRDKKVFVPDVQKDQKIGDVAMTDAQRNEYRRIAGTRIRARLVPMVGALRAMTQEKAQDAIDSVAREEHARAKEAVARMPVKR